MNKKEQQTLLVKNKTLISRLEKKVFNDLLERVKLHAEAEVKKLTKVKTQEEKISGFYCVMLAVVAGMSNALGTQIPIFEEMMMEIAQSQGGSKDEDVMDKVRFLLLAHGFEQFAYERFKVSLNRTRNVTRSSKSKKRSKPNAAR